ncbi:MULTISPECIES: hypothetical protein [Alphaproteobacteria]|uniref:Uncharacterized protein n=2 Tax=Alphaproteobacteria TaxID=28211 RepID=A0A512HF65_9HYPH|nr:MULTISPECIES: hypothetical protein [Alphaproteobacteria]GEO84099.1 hypothetical protein RNA01_10310 [Ciceribacter naphthalenivorans]GLR24635.1 hypothetical protein GCM10007920_44290 [Ciceribacter naphthalenivorans]GLT07491.1 hypothetical protein GCM10007926_44290 [Sphingomonas psychrolutea]
MRKRMKGLAMVLVAILAGAAEPVLTGATAALADSDNVIVESQSNRAPPPPGVRPQRFFCVIQPPDSAETSMMYSCPASPGRVGGRCRCSGMVGSGTLYAR